MWTVVGVGIALGGVFVLLAVVYGTTAWHKALAAFPFYGLIAPALIAGPWLVVFWPRVRRARRVFAESDGRVCTACMHSLKGLPDIGVCPECAEPYHVEVDRETWKHAGVGQGHMR